VLAAASVGRSPALTPVKRPRRNAVNPRNAPNDAQHPPPFIPAAIDSPAMAKVVCEDCGALQTVDVAESPDCDTRGSRAVGGTTRDASPGGSNATDPR
jgi:hypothetical protein